LFCQTLILIINTALLSCCCFRLRDEYFRQRHGVSISRVDVSSSSSLKRDGSQKQHVAEIVMGILKEESFADLKCFCCSSFCREDSYHYQRQTSTIESPVYRPLAGLPCHYCSTICAVHVIVDHKSPVLLLLQLLSQGVLSLPTSNSSSWNSSVSQPFTDLPCCYCSSICAVHVIVSASALSAVAKVVYVDQLLQLLLQLEQSQR